MNKEQKREISQLWFIAKYYFFLSTRMKNKLTKDELQTKVRDNAKACENQSRFVGEVKRFMLTMAHLSSSAVRLSTIDEIRGRNSSRKKLYDGLRKIEDESEKYKITEEINHIIHFMLRHIVAHKEPYTYKPTKKAYGFMQDVLSDLTIEQIYRSLNLVIEDIKNDMKSEHLQ